jgi:uncharacterized membrane protein YsdA (DUF1294 family)
MSQSTIILLCALTIIVVLNVFAFAFFWADKRAAELGEWRISESTLLLLALIGGSAGAIAGQQYWRHKTRKEPFRTMLFCIPAIQLGAVAWFLIRYA